MTGDSLTTAKVVATQCGILRPGRQDELAVDGIEFNKLIRPKPGEPVRTSGLEMGGNVFFSSTVSRYQRFIPILIAPPRFSRVLLPFHPQFHRLFPFPLAASPVLVPYRTCCCCLGHHETK